MIVDDMRRRVLDAVKDALRDVRGRAGAPPLVDTTTPSDLTGSPDQIFADELARLQGAPFRVADRAACAMALREYLHHREVHSVAVQSSDLALDIGAQLSGFDVTRAVERSKLEIAHVDCALLEAKAIIADIGAALIFLEHGSDRVLPYLPRTCAIVAPHSVLYATLDVAAMEAIQKAATAKQRGEAVLVAGPSRTADIEKVLVLGAHGPQAVAVFLIEAT